MTMPDESLPSTGLTFPDGATYGPSRHQTETGASISSAEDSPVKTSAVRVTPSQESTENDQACGESLHESLAWYDQDGCSWRTWQTCLFEGWESFSLTSLPSGLMRNGRLYRLVPWVPHIHGPECSSWPTPRASAEKKGWGVLDRRGCRYRKSTVDKIKKLGSYPSPELYESLIGLPLGWTDLGCGDSATPSSQRSLSGSDGGL